LIVLILVLGSAIPLAAEEIRFELGFGWTLVKPALSSSYINRYQPKLSPSDLYISSSADQTVRFRGKATYGLNGFFNVLFTKAFGMQVLADFHRPRLGGSSDGYDAAVTFQAETEPITYVRSIDGMASEGNLTETTFSLNLLGRFAVADNLALSVSAGPSIYHYEGKAGYVDYTFFNLEVVESEYRISGGTYHTVVEFGPQTKTGLNAGIEAAYEASSHIILAVDLRWFGAPRTDLPMRIVEDPIYAPTTEEMEEAIGLGSLRINPSYLRAGLALRFIF
jgi:hypothetical protein